MKQFPTNLKFKKFHKPSSSFLKLYNNKLFLPRVGIYGLQAIEAGKLTFNQIESGRRTIRRSVKKSATIHINLFTYASITKKPVASRMGKGKGNHSFWICPVRAGQVLYEVSGQSNDLILRALLNAGSKLPVKTKVVKVIY